MYTSRFKHQAGYALLLMVLGLMGVGGVVLAGFTQGAKQESEHQRYLHNQRVLEEAKRALLMYAYNYPDIAGRGPGRLPCPDTNSTGTPNPANDCEDGFGNGLVGRLPWNAAGMQFYDAKDASGESLWYAVSKNFANFNPGTSINSDTAGSITIYDQTGAVIYDGDPLAGTGVAAVIIAPGPAIALDENDDGVYEYTQVRDPAGQNDPRNYLDTFNNFVNNRFINEESDSDDDGFILGPVFEDDPNSAAFNTAVVNDQVMLITTAELIEVAEKSVFQTYRSALNEYRNNIGVDRYPWLDPYDSNDGLGTYNAVATPLANPNIGRMPSIFADYFVNTNPGPSQPIRPELRLSITIEGQVHNMTIPLPPGQDVFFDGAGNLVSGIPNGYSITRFFWDGDDVAPDPNSPRDDIWEMCPTVTFDEEDCNRDGTGAFIGGGSSLVELRTREIDITFIGGAPIVFAFGDRTLSPLEYWRDSPENPDPENHVYIAGEYDDNPSYFAQFDYEQDDNFINSHSMEPPGNEANLIYGTGVADTIKVGLPYYPVLPDWVLVNNWHNMMQVAYSSAMQPGGDGVCTAGVDDCLTLRLPGGGTGERLGLLLLSGSEFDFDPGNPALVDDVNPGAPPYFLDELADIFEDENDDNPPNLTFDYRPPSGNDVVFPLE
jgi:hypothetical protein